MSNYCLAKKKKCWKYNTVIIFILYYLYYTIILSTYSYNALSFATYLFKRFNCLISRQIHVELMLSKTS